MGLIRRLTKRLLLGAPGARPRRVRLGLNRGRLFPIDSGTKGMRLLGLDERELEAPMRALSEGAHVAVDVGANDGWYTVFFATQPGIRVVHAFEPHAPLREQFQRALDLNCIAPERVRLHDEFVGDSTRAGWCRLDDVLGDESGPILLKIDVEGGELDVLRGAERTLARTRCRLIIETHSRALETDCLEFLRARGYAARVVHNAWYRRLLPEARVIEHNRWIVAS